MFGNFAQRHFTCFGSHSSPVIYHIIRIFLNRSIFNCILIRFIMRYTVLFGVFKFRSVRCVLRWWVHNGKGPQLPRGMTGRMFRDLSVLTIDQANVALWWLKIFFFFIFSRWIYLKIVTSLYSYSYNNYSSEKSCNFNSHRINFHVIQLFLWIFYRRYYKLT